MNDVNDAFGRVINYLRVSVTDRCNLRCVYCMPPEGIGPIAHDQVLRFEEIARVVDAAVGLGVRRVRLTGGEPLVRRGIAHLVALLRRLRGLEELSLTTNGILLADMAAELKHAGVDRVNVSLDSLDSERYAAITRGGSLPRVLSGIETARQVGLNPVKVNMVVMRGVNDDETLAMARQSVEQGWHVRFIEMMPLGIAQHLCGESEGSLDGFEARVVSNSAVRSGIESFYGALEPTELASGGPAETWRVPGSGGSIGFISAVSHGFCSSCNRLRLTSEGGLVPCLFSDAVVDLREPLRRGADLAELQTLIRSAVALKGSGHHLAEHRVETDHEMSRIGG
ncbi:MAG: GTP 3',8-cyclase MoaA [Chloroflexi bacterium]|nr:GTP 3',8-cyclase MoaA [Chloroflexota bacterium]